MRYTDEQFMAIGDKVFQIIQSCQTPEQLVGAKRVYDRFRVLDADDNLKHNFILQMVTEFYLKMTIV